MNPATAGAENQIGTSQSEQRQGNARHQGIVMFSDNGIDKGLADQRRSQRGCGTRQAEQEQHADQGLFPAQMSAEQP